jgi:hypothetical protein
MFVLAAPGLLLGAIGAVEHLRKLDVIQRAVFFLWFGYHTETLLTKRRVCVSPH